MTVALRMLTSLLVRALWQGLDYTTFEGYGPDEALKAETVLSAVNVYMCNLIPNKPQYF